MITKERLEQFKMLYQKHYGAMLSDEDAFDKLLNLFELYQTIYAGLEAGLIGKKVWIM